MLPDLRNMPLQDSYTGRSPESSDRFRTFLPTGQERRRPPPHSAGRGCQGTIPHRPVQGYTVRNLPADPLPLPAGSHNPHKRECPPACQMQNMLCKPRAQAGVAKDRRHADKVCAVKFEKKQQSQRIIDIVSDVGIKNDLLFHRHLPVLCIAGFPQYSCTALHVRKYTYFPVSMRCMLRQNTDSGRKIRSRTDGDGYPGSPCS